MKQKQLKQQGLKPSNIEFSEEGILEIIRSFTRESGVRSLEREIANVCRKVARQVVVAKGKKKEHKKSVIAPKVVGELLGVQRYRQPLVAEASEVGLATGLAWTEVGGEVLLTEATTMKGKGHLTLTGKLGEVMQESAKAAFSFVRSRSSDFGLGRDFHKLLDLHVHVPEGAIPKDGPSAGIALATTIISALAGVPVRRDVAMTGEITLRGKVLPIGGVKEKVLAAHRGGIKTVILPRDNEKDLKDIPTSVLEDVKIVFVETMDEVLDIAFEGPIRKKDREEYVKEQRPPEIKEGDRPGVH